MLPGLARSAAGPAVAMVAAGWVRSGDGSSRCSFAPRFPEPPVPEERKPSSFLGLGWLLGYGKKYSSAQLRAEETPTVDGFVNHAIARDLLSLVTLLYATCADPSCHVRSGEAPSAFVERVRREADISKVLGLRKDALVESVERIIHRGPDMLKLDFLGLPQTTDLQAAVTISHHQRRIIVILKGCESLMHWMQTLQVQKEKLFSDIWVHADLHENLMPVYSHILHEVAELQAKHPRYTLYVAGHSLGGAFATLFGFRAANDLPELAIHVVSFGSPRIGNQSFVDAFNALPNLRHTRVTNEEDFITATPVVNFAHCGNNLKLRRNGPAFYRSGALKDGNDRYYAKWWEYSLMNNHRVEAHFISQYHKKMREMSW